MDTMTTNMSTVTPLEPSNDIRNNIVIVYRDVNSRHELRFSRVSEAYNFCLYHRVGMGDESDTIELVLYYGACIYSILHDSNPEGSLDWDRLVGFFG